MQSLLRAYPYFFFHYLFNRLILTRPDLRALWERVGPIEARPLHTLQNYAHQPDKLADALSELERSDWQVQKLNWRSDLATPYWSAVMRQLTDRVPRGKSWSQRAARRRVRSLRQMRVSFGRNIPVARKFLDHAPRNSAGTCRPS